MISISNKYRSSKRLNQAGVLLLATISNIIAQIIINALLARTLTQEGYGNYSYFINLFTFCQVIFNFGFFYTICRLVSISDDKHEIQIYYFEGLKFWVLTSIIMVFSLYIFAFVDIEDLKRNGIEDVFWIVAPLGCVYLLANYNEQILQGNNKISELSISRALPKIMYALILVVIFILNLKFNLLTYLILYFCSHLLVYIYIIHKIHPIADKNSRFKSILIKNNKFGLNIYLGSIMSVGVSNLMGLLISNYCVNNVILGYYNIALQVTTPISLIPGIVSTVFFSDFAKSHSLNKNLLSIVLIISLFLYGLLFVLSDFIIIVIFGKEYLPASYLIKILGFGNVLYGIADFFNRFILARGKAIAVRNISFTIGAIYLISGLALIPHFLAVGASFSKLIVGMIFLILEVSYIYYIYRSKK